MGAEQGKSAILPVYIVVTVLLFYSISEFLLRKIPIKENFKAVLYVKIKSGLKPAKGLLRIFKQ